MGDISFACRACRKELEVEAGLAGQDVACPACGQVMTVPRERQKLTFKGQRSARAPGGAVESAAGEEDLSALSDIHAFEGDRERFIQRRRWWAAVRRVCVLLGLLLSLIGVGYGAWRFYDARDTRQRQAAAALARQEEARALRQTQQRESRRLSAAARRENPYWKLSDGEGDLLWRALNTLHRSAAAEKAFHDWVACDRELFGAFSEQLARIQDADAIEPACQWLAGIALGLRGAPAPLPPLDRFRELAAARLAVKE
ncbi:MAG: hypothetical protein GX590_02720 [Lentisphaerae bacterium]|nr:hypothetical protein [Lentisphaerota bacterium]